MARVRTYSGRKLRAQWREFISLNRNLILKVAAFEIVVIGAITVFLLWLYGPDPLISYVLGAIHATTLCGGYYALRVAFITTSREAMWQVRGDLGETNTRDELRHAKRRKLIWGWVDSITVSTGDIDHLVVTRRGGVVAIDSKWRGEATPDDVGQSAAAAQKAALRSESVLRHLGYLKRETTARRRSPDVAIAVTPLVVLWGPIRQDLPPDARVDGVDFVAGPNLVTWLRDRDCESVNGRSGRQLIRDLCDFREQHQPHD